jgi:hypothetical protein
MLVNHHVEYRTGLAVAIVTRVGQVPECRLPR